MEDQIDTNAELQRIRAECRLTVPRIAAICQVRPATASAWVARPQTQKFRRMPRGYLTLLKIQLGIEQPRKVAG